MKRPAKRTLWPVSGLTVYAAVWVGLTFSGTFVACRSILFSGPR